MVRDLLERLPLLGRGALALGHGTAWERKNIRLPPLEGGKGGFDLVVLVVFGFDVIVDTGDLL